MESLYDVLTNSRYEDEKEVCESNVNFGHAMPRCALQYGAVAKVDMKQKKIYVNR